MKAPGLLARSAPQLVCRAGAGSQPIIPQLSVRPSLLPENGVR